MRDDTSRDSGLVLDMTMPPTSPLDEQNCGGYLSGNLDSELLSQLTQSTTSQHHRISSSGLFDDIQHSGCCSRYSQDVFHSPSDDGFLSTHSASEDQDHHPSHHHPHPHHQHSVFITSGGGGCGQTNVDCSSLPNSYDSNSMMNMLSTGNNNNTNNNQDMKNIHMHSFLDSIASRSDGLQSTSSSYLQHQQLQQQQSILQSGHLMKPIRQKSGGSSSTGGWPSSSSFADDIGHRHSSPISSPILMNNNNNTNASANRFSSVVGTSLAGGGGGGRVSHPAGVDFNTSGLASSASSGSTCAGTFGAIGSRVFHSMTSETTGQSDNSQLTRPQQCSECLTQGGAAGSGACSGGGSMSGGHHMTSSTSSPIQIDSGATATGSRTSSRIFSSHSINENFSNLPQSPILLSSPFSNPGCDLERLTLRRELDEIRQRLDSKEGEVEVLKKQRDFVAEHLRDSLGVIRQLFHSLNMSSTASTDLFKPLFIDTETSMSSDQSTGGGCCPQSLSSESNPCEKFKTCMQMSPMMMVTSPSPSGPTDSFSAGGRSQLQQQQQEALTALFTNPLVSALLNTQTDISGIDASKMKSETQFPNWNPLENYPLEHQTAVHRSSKQLSNNNDNDNNDNPPYSPTTRLHTDDSDDDDDDLFSASGLLSLSNQESCELERSTTTDTNEEDSNDNNNNNNNSNTGSTTHHDEVTNTNANNSDVISTSCCGNDESSPSSSSTTEQAEQSCPATSTTTSASTATAVAAAAIAASTSLLHNLSTDSQQNNNSNNNGDKNICQSPSSSPKTSTAIEADQSTTTTTT
uniref:Uncharacterized protein n=1 Tax=Trichobilharzia regenti TaxID=157069 RepID=A0AA85J363_TRIRE|nr:unnamed protein product [Trichobilharzia regenti]